MPTHRDDNQVILRTSFRTPSFCTPLLHLSILAVAGSGTQFLKGAEWLSGALLISDEAALHIVRTGMPDDKAMTLYGVSRKMLQFRLNVTGARVRVARSRNFTQRRYGNIRTRR
jgi:hypothetical protein